METLFSKLLKSGAIILQQLEERVQEVYLRLRIPYIDRIGIVHDISSILSKRGTSIRSMEVEEGTVFLECQNVNQDQRLEIIEELSGISGVQTIVEIPFMPSKGRADQLDAIVSSVQDGILVVNQDGIITQCNPAAVRILRLSAQQAQGQPLDPGLIKHLLIRETLETGCQHTNREVFITSDQGYCVVNTIPLRNNSGDVVGVIAVIRDTREVRNLMRNMTTSLPMTFADIPFISPVMEKVVGQARRYATSDSTILINGETGTGKELFARALHSASGRANAAFVPINCAAIPDTLLESELFGYAEGAFTGAVKGGKPGLFELANGGTLFLDEVGDVSAHLQVKLLRVLQEQRVRRVGSNKEVAIDVRIIAATNRSLEKMVAEKTFREDLFYRLNVIPLQIPPLRERFEDIRLLSNLFLKRYAEKLQRPLKGFSPSALQRLESYNWPGNVRELKNIIERAVNLVDGEEVRSEHIFLSGPSGSIDLPTLVQFETYQTLEERLGEVERIILQQTYQRFRSSRRMGAVLGLSHTAVLKKMRKYELPL
ncbi:PAS domain S-box [Desulfosporosinus orientis DSM 765]|uniref:HTH-type transcriptional regulatory protein TyrR n=1 Tax=Desulfosporosinus orientis (strain ATCC 19365 / DSM 765 / NCIMB 8382 / VKM B-1628 / Singapore I) TaxID=768706 RepID=G7W9L8_DESOD|nr:PAS domain S-box [Desulfosporosinus orientis DSM 765]